MCVGHEHQGLTHLNEVFYIPVEKLYEHLFTDSVFFREFVQRRKTYGKKLAYYILSILFFNNLKYLYHQKLQRFWNALRDANVN